MAAGDQPWSTAASGAAYVVAVAAGALLPAAALHWLSLTLLQRGQRRRRQRQQQQQHRTSGTLGHDWGTEPLLSGCYDDDHDDIGAAAGDGSCKYSNSSSNNSRQLDSSSTKVMSNVSCSSPLFKEGEELVPTDTTMTPCAATAAAAAILRASACAQLVPVAAAAAARGSTSTVSDKNNNRCNSNGGCYSWVLLTPSSNTALDAGVLDNHDPGAASPSSSCSSSSSPATSAAAFAAASARSVRVFEGRPPIAALLGSWLAGQAALPLPLPANKTNTRSSCRATSTTASTTATAPTTSSTTSSTRRRVVDVYAMGPQQLVAAAQLAADDAAQLCGSHGAGSGRRPVQVRFTCKTHEL